MRICKECKLKKNVSEFYLKSNGKPKTSYCKSCYRLLYKKKYDKEYYENNKEKFKESYKKWIELNDRTEYRKKYWTDNSDVLKTKQKEFRDNNKELVAERKSKYYEGLSYEKKEELRERKRENYHKNNYKENKRLYINERLNNDELFKLKFNIRTLIRNSMKRQFTEKSKRTQDILGCSFEEFKIYLESMFDENMNWENQGTYWHLDHIIPISSANTKEEVYKLNHYTNFQPLYWLENIKKSNKINE
jgi:hypothetical protein